MTARSWVEELGFPLIGATVLVRGIVVDEEAKVDGAGRIVVDDGSGAVPVEAPDTIVAQMPRGGLDRMTAHPVEVEGVLGRDPTGRPRIRARRVRFLGAPIDGVKEVRA